MNKLLTASILTLSLLINPIQSFACDCENENREIEFNQTFVKSYSVLQLREIEVWENTGNIIAFVLDDNTRHITIRIPYNDDACTVEQYANSIFIYDYANDILTIEYNSPVDSGSYMDEFGNMFSS